MIRKELYLVLTGIKQVKISAENLGL